MRQSNKPPARSQQPRQPARKPARPAGRAAAAKNPNSSWEPVEKWYRNSVGDEGHYYHQHVVIPGVLKLLALKETRSPSLLDLACGNGVLARQLPEKMPYIGVDISPSLLKAARSADKSPHHGYVVSDATKKLVLEKNDFSHAAIILAIQNMQEPKAAFQNAADHLKSGGHLVVVMNHPCFRIPRQTSWKVDEPNKIQYRRVDRYSSPLQIPIQTHPSKGEESTTTWSFHYPLASYCQWLFETGFHIELIEEWHSNKVSTGGAAKMENRSRTEIPLFMAIRAIKT